MTATTTGTLRDRFRFVRIGRGSRPLLVLPGLALVDDPPSGIALTAYAHGFRILAADHTVHIVSRPSGIPTGATTQSIASEYARMVRDELGGPVPLLGFSTGGLIAQYLALDHPDLVERVALAVTGTRLGPDGRDLCTGWLAQAAGGRWRELHGSLAAAAVDGRPAQWVARTVLSRTGRSPTDEEAADFVATVSADLAHDTRDTLPGLRMPALVVGGAQDPFFPEPILRETAAAAPGSVLRIFPDHGHGVPKHCARRMQQQIAEFLAGGAG
jgi:pimeloyl-ACP methyl ester carboxylesterase